MGDGGVELAALTCFLSPRERFPRKNSRIEPMNQSGRHRRWTSKITPEHPNAAPSPLNEEKGRGEE